MKWSGLQAALSRRLGLTLPFVSGLLLALAFPDTAIFPLAWVAFIPYLVFLLAQPRGSELMLGHAIFSLAYFGVVLYWIPGVLSSYAGFGVLLSGVSFLALLLLLSLFLIPFSLGVWLLASRSEWLALLAAPSLWLMGELIRNYFPAGGFPWGSVGYSQYPLKWFVQVADLGGVYLLSFFVMAGNCALLALLRCPRKLGNSYAAVVGLFFLLANIYGGYRIRGDFEGNEELLVDLVQPAIQLSQDSEYYARVYYRDVADSFRRAAADGSDWVVLPEAPNPFAYGTNFYYTSFWRKLASDFRVPVLLSSTTSEDQGRRQFNSVYLVDEAGVDSFRYDKSHLVPFGEYLPYGRLLGFARPLVQQVGRFTPGDLPTEPGLVRGQPFGMLICYESIFPSISRRWVQMGATFLVNVTNDHWFGETSAPGQHLEMAAFRAIETRRPILRAANSGYSALIDARGQIHSRTKLNQVTINRVRVRPGSATTLYSLWGQGLNVSLIMLSSALLWATGRQRN